MSSSQLKRSQIRFCFFPATYLLRINNPVDKQKLAIFLKMYQVPTGIRIELLDFYEDEKRDGESISNKYKSIIGCDGLQLRNISAYSADNASINYGIPTSIFQKLQSLVSVYSEYSSHSERTSELKSISDLLKFKEIIRHVPIRWFSVSAAIDRILLIRPAVESYFFSQGERECSAFIWEAIKRDDDNSLPL
ncbi:hypothetical protein J437_LFUL002962, partial [Ladona fulva]